LRLFGWSLGRFREDYPKPDRRMKLTKTFQQLFCEHFQCPPETYQKKIFWMCLHHRAFPVAALIFLLHPDFFTKDFDLIGQLGVTESQREFQQEIEDYSYQIKAYGNLLQRTFRVRLSGKRLMRLSKIFS
jgi:hypothetical protein